MSPVVRVLVIALVRLGLVFFAAWFAFDEGSLGAGAPLVSRIGIVLVCLVLSILIGELDRIRTHFALLLGALRAAGGAAGGAAVAAAADLPEAGTSDPRASVDILIRALGATDAGTVSKAHRHLVRLTGKRLPPDIALWERWWQENRDGYQGPPARDAGNGPSGS